MEPTEWSSRRQVFGEAVEAYDSARPGYPDTAVGWCIGQPESPIRVVDLGAGTGKLTRTLLSLRHEVVAVEPDEKMLARLDSNLRGQGNLETARGSAEEIPVDEGSVDAVISGQAFHWFDPETAPAEMARVLRPGGHVSALWNTRDEGAPWVAEMSRILGEAADTTHGATGRNVLGDSPDFGPGFDDYDNAEFRHVQRLDRTGLHALALSRSHTINLPEPERERMLEDLDELVATHASLAGKKMLSLPYVVECFRAVRI